MTDIKHHLTEAILLAYSAGTLPEAFGLVVASHVSLCDDCRARLDALDAVGGAVLECCESQETVSLQATMDLIRNAPDEPLRPRRIDSDLPEPLASYLGGGSDKIRWSRVGGGVRQAVLSTTGRGTARLLHIPAGTMVPDHSHGGLEMTLVLKGSYSDEGDRFAAGDVEIADAHMHHQPISDGTEDCICLAATDARLKFAGLLPRLVGRFAGI